MSPSTNTTTPQTPLTSSQGASIYNPLLLAIYDWWVLGIVSTHAWRCPTTRTLLPFFRANVSQTHLDIGVGTGYYLAHSALPPDVSVTLLDLNPNSLAVAKARFGRPDDTRTVRHDVFLPLPFDGDDGDDDDDDDDDNDAMMMQKEEKGKGKGKKFGSISMFYLLHCLPGPPERKMAVFEHVREVLAPGGVVYGASILGKGVRQNWFGRAVLAGGNWKGFLDNRGDGEEELRRGLEAWFERVEGRVVGSIFLFRCWGPRA